VYVIDLGASTAECHSGRVESDLDYGMRYIYDKIGTIMGTGKASWNVGIVGCRTDDTDNPLQEQGEEYQNITVLKPLGPMNLSQLSEIRQKIVPSETETGDVVSGVVLAIDTIDKFTILKSGKPGKFVRKIVLLTDGQGEIDDDIESISDKINESDIELVVMCVPTLPPDPMHSS
jgi:ATP-dependent DNA helicase 2 subunit 2